MSTTEMKLAYPSGGVKVRLMNSAMMPEFGRYEYRPLTAEQFARAVKAAHDRGELVSYVGYQQTADLIARISGVPVQVSREMTTLNDGDEILIAKLAYRVGDPKTKGDPVPEDFVFGHAVFTR